MEQLLTQIDSIKEKITDQEYRDMMNSLKTMHDKKDDKFKYELVIGRIYNYYQNTDCAPVEYHIEKITLIPKQSFTTTRAKLLIEDTKKGGGILDNPIPLKVNLATSTVYAGCDLPKSIYHEDQEKDEDEVVATYQEYTLLAVREIKD